MRSSARCTTTLRGEEWVMAEELYPRTTEILMKHTCAQDHAYREREKGNLQEIDTEMTIGILPETTVGTHQETTTEDHQETDIEIEDMKIEAVVEKEVMKMTGQRGPAMEDKGDTEVVARSPWVMGGLL